MGGSIDSAVAGIPSGRNDRLARLDLAEPPTLCVAFLNQALADLAKRVDIGPLEAAYIQVVAAYSTPKGIEYATWRDVGVLPAVFDQAGVRRN